MNQEAPFSSFQRMGGANNLLVEYDDRACKHIMQWESVTDRKRQVEIGPVIARIVRK